VGSVRIAHLCRYLPNYGIEPIVLSVRDDYYEVRDDTMSVPANLRVLRTRMIPNPLDWYSRVKRYFNSSTVSAPSIQNNNARVSSVAALRRHILALLQFPDRRWGWYLPAIRSAERFAHEEGVDAIFSSGPPWISQVIALGLKKKLGVPWLVDFRDPWASLAPGSGPAWAHNLAKRLETDCMHLSDLVLCNTDRMNQALQQHYAELDPTKFRTLTNGYEHLAIPVMNRTHSRRLLLHLGSIYGLRRIDTFLAAVSDLVSSRRLSPESFQVILQGDMSPSLAAESARAVPELLKNGCIEFRPRTSWTEAHALLWEADLLLLFQGSHELQVPAKFYEYLQTGIPIFAVTEEGALTDILDATESGIWARAGDWEQIASMLLQALQLPRRTPEYMRSRFSGQYHYAGLAERLSRWVQEVVDRSSLRKTR
jgi:glycosyltransferase involved in cell wall biosynthesis